MAAPSFRPRDQPKNYQIETPSASEKVWWFHTFQATTIILLNTVLKGIGPPSVTFTVRFATSFDAVGTVLFSGTETSTTTGTDRTPAVALVPARRHVWIETTAISGTPRQIGFAMDKSP